MNPPHKKSRILSRKDFACTTMKPQPENWFTRLVSLCSRARNFWGTLFTIYDPWDTAIMTVSRGVSLPVRADDDWPSPSTSLPSQVWIFFFLASQTSSRRLEQRFISQQIIISGGTRNWRKNISTTHKTTHRTFRRTKTAARTFSLFRKKR